MIFKIILQKYTKINILEILTAFYIFHNQRLTLDKQDKSVS